MNKHKKAKFLVGDKLKSIVETNYINELVERATPKKTLNTKYVLYNEKLVECPICGKNDLKANFCRHCGQALDWSDSNE